MAKCQHGRIIKKKEQKEAKEKFNWEEEHKTQKLRYSEGRKFVEKGRCVCCGHPYRKTVSESNTSMSGKCMTCGFNP